MSHEFGPGDLLLERYMVDGVIGAGGMATVYQCSDLRLDVTVAVKMLRRQFRRQSDVVRRFLREAKLQAKLRHPNIVHVTNVEDREELTIMVMEFMKGMTLGEYANAKGVLCEQEAIDFLVPVLDALSVAHNEDVVHRDFKPSNIFLAESSGTLIPKLMDFGVARELDASITTSSTLLGTLPYMSFELVQSARNGSPASDVYAAGVTLFELITGKYPVESRTLQEYVFAMMELKEARSIRSLRPEVSAELDAVLAKALKKEPSERYADARALADALEALPADRPKAGTSSAPVAGAPRLSAPSLAPSASGVGRTGFDDAYNVETQLDAGPVGCVYVCLGSNGQKVVVKLLDEDVFADESARGPILAAAQRQGELAQTSPFLHPVTRVHEGFGAIVSPHSGGQTLQACLTTFGRFEAPYAVELFVLLSDALRIAHQGDLLHRHLYPGNIFLAQQSDGVMTPQIMDFGHLTHFPSDRLDALGPSMSCLAPELGGKLHAATPTSDIYALGVVMYQTVTGKRPVESADFESMQAELTGVDALPDASTHAPDLPKGLCQVIGWCLSLAPERRYQKVEEVHRDLLAVRHMVKGY